MTKKQKKYAPFFPAFYNSLNMFDAWFIVKAYQLNAHYRFFHDWSKTDKLVSSQYRKISTHKKTAGCVERGLTLLSVCFWFLMLWKRISYKVFNGLCPTIFADIFCVDMSICVALSDFANPYSVQNLGRQITIIRKVRFLSMQNISLISTKNTAQLAPDGCNLMPQIVPYFSFGS